MNNFREDISKRIVSLRNTRNITQEQLAEALDISNKHCSCVERGIAMLSLEKLVLCAEVLRVSLDYLLTGKDTLFIPASVLTLYENGGQSEKKLLEDYLEMYAKMRSVTCEEE